MTSPAPTPQKDIRFPATMSARTRSGAPSPVLTLIVLLATLGILVYSAFLLNPSHRGDVVPYVLVLVAESLLVFHALISMWTILAGASDPRDFDYYRTHSKLFERGSKGPQSG